MTGLFDHGGHTSARRFPNTSTSSVTVCVLRSRKNKQSKKKSFATRHTACKPARANDFAGQARLSSNAFIRKMKDPCNIQKTLQCNVFTVRYLSEALYSGLMPYAPTNNQHNVQIPVAVDHKRISLVSCLVSPSLILNS